MGSSANQLHVRVAGPPLRFSKQSRNLSQRENEYIFVSHLSLYWTVCSIAMSKENPQLTEPFPCHLSPLLADVSTSAPNLEWVPHSVSPPFSCKLLSHPSPGTSQLPRDPGRILLSKTPLVFGSAGAFMLMELSSHEGLRHFKGLAHLLSRKRRLSLGLSTSLLVSGPVGFLPYIA